MYASGVPVVRDRLIGSPDFTVPLPENCARVEAQTNPQSVRPKTDSPAERQALDGAVGHTVGLDGAQGTEKPTGASPSEIEGSGRRPAGLSR